MNATQTIAGRLMFKDAPGAFVIIDPGHVCDLTRWA